MSVYHHSESPTERTKQRKALYKFGRHNKGKEPIRKNPDHVKWPRFSRKDTTD